MKLHKKIAAACGYQLISTKKITDMQIAQDEHLRLLLDRQKIDLVIDVGANIGQYGQLLRKVGYKGEIYSFEPVEQCYEQLQQVASKDKNWQTFPFALGREKGVNQINVFANDSFSSIRDFNEYSQGRFSSRGTTVTKTQEIKVERLDESCKTLAIHSDTRIHLKMDTQGFDVEVFAGAEGVLDQIWSMQSELSVTPIYAEAPDYIEALSAYREKGYEITGMYPISGDRDSMVLVECDCYLSKR